MSGEVRVAAARLGALVLTLAFGLDGMPERAWAATLFDGVVSTPHHLALSPEESCLLCHTSGSASPSPQSSPSRGEGQGEGVGRPLWAEKSRIPPFTLDAQPVLGADLDYHPSGPSTACLACHDGVLAVNVHGVSPEVERRAGNVEGLRMMDHPDSILYPRRTDGTSVTERTPPHISRYFTIPDRPDRSDRPALSGAARQQIEMPHGPVSAYLLRSSGLTSVGPDAAPLLVRTTSGRIHCDSCHDPHSNRFTAFLRGSPRTLCLVCHDR